MPASVTNDTAPDRPYSAQVGFISPTAEFTPKTVETREISTNLVYRLRVVVDNPDGGLRQGMPVTVKTRLPQPRRLTLWQRLRARRLRAMSEETLILAENLTKRFSAAAPPAIDRLCARVGPGEVTGVVGPDGAGKTTLLRLFAGLLLPSDGRLTVCGADTRTELDVIRQQVSYMPQRFGLYEDLSVQQNLNLYADLRNVVGAIASGRLRAAAGLHRSASGLPAGWPAHCPAA